MAYENDMIDQLVELNKNLSSIDDILRMFFDEVVSRGGNWNDGEGAIRVKQRGTNN